MYTLATQATHNPLPGERALVVGLGKTGLSCARFLHGQGFEVAVTDSRPQPPYLETLREELPDVAVFVGGFDPRAFAQCDFIVLSPGVAASTMEVAAAVARGTPLLGDIEIFARYVTQPVVAITGSNGKSTVTRLVGDMVQRAGLHAAVAGNIGTPVLDLLDDSHIELFVLELSSFQLETTHSLDAVAAALLNISADHMDRYDSLQAYMDAKRAIFNGHGVMVYNRGDARVNEMVAQFPDATRRRISFGLDVPAAGDFGLRQHAGETWLARGETVLLPQSALRIHGRHNVLNVLAALALGTALELPDAAMQAAVQAFSGLPHRTQWVASRNGVSWFNDSKATNIGATVAAIEGFADRPLVLIAGGQGKGQDFGELRDALARNAGEGVRAVLLFGEDADRIAAAVGDVVSTECVADLEAAVHHAAQLADAGDAVLLSPACASFDMFSGFEERGQRFMELVEKVVTS